MTYAEYYPRDMIGYGTQRPRGTWPNGAKVAVQFVVNYEEGGENNVLDGDAKSEAFLAEEPSRELLGGRNLLVESQYEYGSRVGFWRLHRLFTERGIPVTVFGVTTALARNPEAVSAMRAAGWEIASHGLRWIDYASMPKEEEREHVVRSLELHRKVVGEAARGWYTGRVSPHTRELVVECGSIDYDSDSFADDAPYWVQVQGTSHLVIPYSLDNNDGRYVNSYGFGGTDFAEYLQRGLQLLIAENMESPVMMSIGLHCRLSGRPGRSATLARFLDWVLERDDVWLARRIDICDHWKKNHPFDPEEGALHVKKGR